MNASAKQANPGQAAYWLISLVLIAASSAAVISAAPYRKKWLAAVSLAVSGTFVSFILRTYLRDLMLLLLVLVIPLRIDFYVIFRPTYFIQTHSYPGLPVTLFDVVLLISLAYLVLQFVRGAAELRFYPALSVPAIIYILLSGISAFRSIDPLLSFSALVLMVKAYLVFLYFANRIQTDRDISIVVLGLAGGVLLQTVVGLLQYATGGAFLSGVFGVPQNAFKMQIQGLESISRVGGTIGHPNMLAKYLCFCILLFLGYLFKASKNGVIALLAWIGAFCGGITLLLTMSRGSWLALTLAVCYLFYEVFRIHFRSRAKSMLFVCLTMAALLGATLALFEDVRVRLFENDYGSAEARVPMAQVALRIIQDHPVAGVGLDNYTAVMHSYDHTRERQTYKFPHPVHNSYLLVAAEAGIPALLAFLWLIFNAVRNVRPLNSSDHSFTWFLQTGCMAAVLTWLISALFDRDFPGTNDMLWMTIGLVAANYRLWTARNKVRPPHQPRSVFRTDNGVLPGHMSA